VKKQSFVFLTMKHLKLHEIFPTVFARFLCGFMLTLLLRSITLWFV